MTTNDAGSAPLERPVGQLKPERDKPCPHCGSVACANGGGNMNGYWVIHPGCAWNKPWAINLDSTR